MKLGRAIVAGLVGAAVVIVIFVVARWVLGPGVDLNTLLGSIVLPGGGRWAWIVGVVLQLALGGVAGIVYAILFEYAARRAGWLVGLVIGIGHALFAGVVLGFLPLASVNGAPPDAPGAFLEYRGLWAGAVLVAAHVMYGAVVGALYGDTRHSARGRAVRWSVIGGNEEA